MNKDRRKQLEDVRDSLDEIISSLNDIKDEEQDAYDNMPESLQSSDKGSRMTDAIDTIDEAISSIEEAQQHNLNLYRYDNRRTVKQLLSARGKSLRTARHHRTCRSRTATRAEIEHYGTELCG